MAVVVAAAADAIMVGDDRASSGRAPNPGYVPGRDSLHSEGRKPAAAAPSKIAITQQYRERHNMTYELDCAGQSLVVRVFFPAEVGPVEWRLEARGKGGGEPVVVDKVAATRELALQAICGAWPSATLSSASPGYDWDGVTQVLRSGRAI